MYWADSSATTVVQGRQWTLATYTTPTYQDRLACFFARYAREEMRLAHVRCSSLAESFSRRLLVLVIGVVGASWWSLSFRTLLVLCDIREDVDVEKLGLPL